MAKNMTRTNLSLKKTFPYLMIVVATIGLIASLILSYDTLQISGNSHYTPICNLNPVLSCGSVINATGDKIFGLPYPYYGIAAFGVLLSAGVGILAGARMKRWYWLAFQGVVTLGTIGAYLLLLKSIFKIHALCPFCLTIDVVTTTLFWYTTLYNIDTGIIKIKNPKLKKAHKWARAHHLDLLILWFLIVIALILKHFWYYYGKHL
jgi:uncharacterized membrane protein